MEGIYYKDGVYVLIDNNEKHENCIYHDDYRSRAELYGRRVKLGSEYGKHGVILIIDGVNIIEMGQTYDYNGPISKYLKIDTVANYLNAIEIYGVDEFMQNYKKNIDFIYCELKESIEKSELKLSYEQDKTEISNIFYRMKDIKKALYTVLILLFSLNNIMDVGLENEKVISVYQSIMDTIA